MGHKYHTANARGLQATGGWRCLSVNSVPLLFPTPLDQLCIEDFPEVPSLGPKLWGKKIKRTQEECKQLLQSQQQILAPKPMDLFSFEELERKEDDECFRKSALPQLDLWSLADAKQAPAIQELLQITQGLGLQIYLPFLDISNDGIP